MPKKKSLTTSATNTPSKKNEVNFQLNRNVFFKPNKFQISSNFRFIERFKGKFYQKNVFDYRKNREK